MVKKANHKAATERAWREMHKGLPTRIRIGKCYVFMRAEHEWHSDTVAVIVKDINGGGVKVARASDVCEYVLTPNWMRRRMFKMWTATPDELW